MWGVTLRDSIIAKSIIIWLEVGLLLFDLVTFVWTVYGKRSFIIVLNGLVAI